MGPELSFFLVNVHHSCRFDTHEISEQNKRLGKAQVFVVVVCGLLLGEYTNVKLYTPIIVIYCWIIILYTFLLYGCFQK